MLTLKATMNQILIIEDDEDIAFLLKSALELAQYQVKVQTDGLKLHEILEQNGQLCFQLLIVDWMLPHGSGLEITKKIRQQFPSHQLPILLLTAMSQHDNMIQALDAGADDYVTKPFHMGVLLARVKALLRRHQTPKNNLFELGELSLQATKCEVKVKGEKVHLTPNEYQLLKVMFDLPGHVFTREQLINKILGEGVFVTERTIDTHIAGLRRKLKGCANYVETVRGVGYRLTDEPHPEDMI